MSIEVRTNAARAALAALLIAAAASVAHAQDGSGCAACESAGYPVRSDVNADGRLDLSDPVSLLGWLFLGGPAPACPPVDHEPEVDAPEACCADCGDANGDGARDIADAVRVLDWLFQGGTSPACESASAAAAGCVGALPAVVDAASLAERLDGGGVLVLDIRSASSYGAGHVPGAVRFDAGLLRATVDGVPGQAAPLASARTALRAAGLTEDRDVVVCGSATDTSAARVVWSLRYYGHERAALLDGGMTAWTAAGFASESDAAVPAPSTWDGPGLRTALRVDAAWVFAHLDDPGLVLVDARSSAEFASGHIPGARSVDWQRNVASGALLGVDDVSALYPEIPDGATIVTYCQTGSRASVAWLALTWLGYADVRLYDGSWAEWGSRADLPREVE